MFCVKIRIRHIYKNNNEGDKLNKNIKIKELNINYKVQGKGDKILLLHGWGVNMSYFDGIITSLEKSHEVIALDLPGFGESDEPKEAWSATHYGDFVLEFIKSLKIDKLSLLGHSNGGRIIINIASRKELPFEIDKIILTASAGIVHKKTLKQKINTMKYKIGRIILSSKIVSKANPNALEEYRSKYGSADYRNATPIMRQTLVLLVNEDLRHLLPGIKMPTLLLWGDQDTATPIGDAKIMEKLLPDAGLVTLRGGTHFAYMEQPVIVDKVLNSFLNVEEV